MKVAKNIKRADFILFSIILLGLLLRLLVFFLPGFQIDVTAWFAWAERLNQVGFASFYSDQIWTNYTPGFLYILAILGFIKNLFSINDSLFYLILKLTAIVAEIGMAIFVYKYFNRRAALLILLTPAFIFNSSVWGQIDGLLTFLMLLTIYYLNEKKLFISSVFFGLSFLIKPQAIALLPAVALYLFQFKSLKNILKFLISSALVIFIFSFPFFTNQIYGLPNLFSKMLSDYSYTSLFAYNFWGAVGFWIPDGKFWFNLTYQNWGYILLGLFYILNSYLYLKRKISLWTFTTLILLGFYFLPTRVHERYLYPGLVFLTILTTTLKSRLFLMLTLTLGFIHLFNLYFVYVYYNEVYLNMPKVLYNSVLFNFLQNNGKNLSIISTLIFVIISFCLIKISYVKKN